MHNEEIDSILWRDEEEGMMCGRVCILCDKLMSKKEEGSLGVKTLVKNLVHLKAGPNIPAAVKRQCRFEMQGDSKSNTALQGCLLSPRARVEGTHNSKKVSCCMDCKGGHNAKSLKKGLPKVAMANGMAIGRAPECLTRLNETEVALVSQARFRGHFFTC